MEWFFFESWLALLIVGVLMNFAALVHWRRGGTPRPLLGTLAITITWWITQSVVVTPTERADRLLRDIEDDVLASKTDRIAAVLAPDFAAGEMNRERFIERVKSSMRTFDVRTLSRVRLEILDRSGERFQVGVSYWANVSRGSIGGYTKSLWKIEFASTPHGWKISRIEPEEINEIRVESWDRMPR
ncbi:MAG: hypothetical protein ACKVS9_00375 [Phycisphaerae bacterium]